MDALAEINATTLFSSELLTLIIEAVSTAIIMVDKDGRIKLVNKHTEQLFGYTRQELIGELIDILVPYKFRVKHPELRQSYLHSHSTRPMGAGRDLFGLHKNGSEIPIEIGLNPIVTRAGTYIVSAIVDITERKRLEARFKATVESAPTAMLMINQAGTIVLVNKELEKMFGYERDKLLNNKVEALLPERYRNGHSNLRTQYFANPETRRMGVGRDLFGLHKQGHEFPIEIGLKPIEMDEGSFVLSAIVDISDRKMQAERREIEILQRANEALERSNIELQRFVYIASHDLQTPMRSIGNFADLLCNTYQNSLDNRAKDWLRRIKQSVTYLQTLVSDLLEYSRLDSQIHVFKFVSFQEIVDHAISLLDSVINDSNTEIICDKLPTIFGDRTLLVQLVVNLISNAIKYRCKKRPQIHISSQENEEEWLIMIKDNGIGIDKKYFQKIFEIFQRLHDHSTYQGTGIGLAVSRRVVILHHGRIWVESEPGLGSTFYFTIKKMTEEN
ncbi:MAG: PAS domain S-box protein [Proteobacteria bacterium]|nr:PAS domain S-box protein [Pseudomonadota bacterium]